MSRTTYSYRRGACPLGWGGAGGRHAPAAGIGADANDEARISHQSGDDDGGGAVGQVVVEDRRRTVGGDVR